MYIPDGSEIALISKIIQGRQTAFNGLLVPIYYWKIAGKYENWPWIILQIRALTTVYVNIWGIWVRDIYLCACLGIEI
jgi:hypothetical protein